MSSEFDPKLDYYEILGLKPPVTSFAVHTAYTKAIEAWQRDGCDPARLTLLEQAKRVLQDVLLRATYDKAREKLRATGGQPEVKAPAPVVAVAPAQKSNPASVTQYEPASKAGIEDAERRVADFPDDLDALSWLAFQYYSAGEYPKAIEAYTRYTAGRDDDPEGFYYLARAYQRTNQTAEMAKAAQRVIELEPNGDRAKKSASMLK